MNTVSMGSSTENRAAAERWLDKAIKMEEEGKGKGLVDKALEKACEYENLANAK